MTDHQPDLFTFVARGLAASTEIGRILLPDYKPDPGAGATPTLPAGDRGSKGPSRGRTGHPARARRTDPATSHGAARSISPEGVSASQRLVLVLLANAKHPMTDDELDAAARERGSRFSPARLRTARKELAERALIARATAMGESNRGRPAQQWLINERGRAALEVRHG
jgi:hypothetical protein